MDYRTGPRSFSSVGRLLVPASSTRKTLNWRRKRTQWKLVLFLRLFPNQASVSGWKVRYSVLRTRVRIVGHELEVPPNLNLRILVQLVAWQAWVPNKLK